VAEHGFIHIHQKASPLFAELQESHNRYGTPGRIQAVEQNTHFLFKISLSAPRDAGATLAGYPTGRPL
jgi:hypothetical protein